MIVMSFWQFFFVLWIAMFVAVMAALTAKDWFFSRKSK